MTQSLKIGYMGTPDFALPALQKIINSSHDVVCVYTQPPRPKGRGQQVQKSPVHMLADSAHIPVFHPKNFKDESAIAEFQNHNLDVAIVAAYGLILPKAILQAPKFGCINIHGSLLPRWRGAAPIQRAILEGDSETGITIMHMDEGLDTGPMISKKSTPITPTTTAQDLHDSLANLGADMIIETLNALAQNQKLDAENQPVEGSTYANMLTKDDGRIDWLTDASYIDRQVRALNPWPGVWCLTQDHKRLKIHAVELAQSQNSYKPGYVHDNGIIECGHNTHLKFIIIQPENKKPMDFQAALNGGYIKVGECLC